MLVDLTLNVMTFPDLISKRGAAVLIADAMGVSHSTVMRWARRRIPLARVPELARVTGIPAAKLRPDVAALLGKRKGRAP